MGTVLKIVLGIVLSAILLVGGCAVIVGGAANEVAKDQAKSDSESVGGSSSKTADKVTEEGVIGNWKISNMDQLKFTEEFGYFKSVDLKIRNVSKEADSPWLEIRLTNKKKDLVATYTCIGDEYEPGQGGTLGCSSTDKFGPFTDWEIKNQF